MLSANRILQCEDIQHILLHINTKDTYYNVCCTSKMFYDTMNKYYPYKDYQIIFSNLANYNKDNYHNLLVFSNSVLNDQVSAIYKKRIINIYGNGANLLYTMFKKQFVYKTININKLANYYYLYRLNKKYLVIGPVNHINIVNYTAHLKMLTGGDQFFDFRKGVVYGPNYIFIIVTTKKIICDESMEQRIKYLNVENNDRISNFDSQHLKLFLTQS
jgi:hypothetical protein